MSEVVKCTGVDSIQIETAGGGRSLLIPASCVLAIDRVLRAAVQEEEGGFALDEMESEAGEVFWRAAFGSIPWGDGATPWEAIVALAAQLDQR